MKTKHLDDSPTFLHPGCQQSVPFSIHLNSTVPASLRTPNLFNKVPSISIHDDPCVCNDDLTPWTHTNPSELLELSRCLSFAAQPPSKFTTGLEHKHSTN